MSSIMRSLGLLLLLPILLTSATPIEGDTRLEDRGGDTCGKVRDIVEALNRLPQPWKLCEEQLKPETKTVRYTTTPVVTDYKYATVVSDAPGCTKLSKRDVAINLDALPEIVERDYDIQLPPSLKKWGLQNVREACRCLPKPPKITITKTVTAQTSTVTLTKTKTVCP